MPYPSQKKVQAAVGSGGPLKNNSRGNDRSINAAASANRITTAEPGWLADALEALLNLEDVVVVANGRACFVAAASFGWREPVLPRLRRLLRAAGIEPEDVPEGPTLAMDADLASGIQKFHDEASGSFEIYIIRPPDIPRILNAANAGDRRAMCFMIAISDFIAAPKVCLGCDAVVTPPTAIAIALPANDAGSAALVMGACRHCGDVSNAELSEQMQHWLRRIWPSMREIEVSRQGGRA